MHFDGLYYEAAEVAHRISAGQLESRITLDSSVETMAALVHCRRRATRRSLFSTKRQLVSVLGLSVLEGFALSALKITRF